MPARSARLERTAIWLLVVLVGLFVIDRGALAITEHRLASRIQNIEQLPSRPKVRIHGFLFLPQVVQGRYGSVSLGSPDPIHAAGIEVDQAEATLHSVRVTFRDVVHGTVSNVPVRSGHGSAVIPYSSLNSAVKKYGGATGSLVRVRAGHSGRARLVGPLGLAVAITARVEGGKLIITPSSSDLANLPESISQAASAALAGPIPLPAFPFNVHLSSGSFRDDGLHLAAVSHGSVFPVR